MTAAVYLNHHESHRNANVLSYMERWRRAETVSLDSGSQTFAQWEEHSWALHTFNESNENFDCMVKSFLHTKL